MIKGHQVVRLQHTELGGYLTSDDLDFTDDALAEVYVRCHEGDLNDMEALTSGDLFEVEIANNYDRGQVCVWSDPNDNKNMYCYRLRHLNTGRLVRIQEVTIRGKKITSLGLSDHITENNVKDLLDVTLFNLYSTTVDTDNRIRTGTSLKIQSAKSKEYLSTKADIEWTGGVQGGGERSGSKQNKRPKGKDSMEDILRATSQAEVAGIIGKRNKGKRTGIYHPLDDDELYNCRNNVIELSKKASNEDAFLITLVDHSEVKDLLFIQTVSTQLYSYTRYLRANRMDEIEADTLAKIIKYLTKLVFFITVSESTDPETWEGYPIKSRQKLMREMRVVELLVDCLYYPFVNEDYTIEGLTNEMPLKKICILCYRLILHSVKDYRLNELYASQWIELFFDQSMASAETNIKAENTIAVLVSNNRTLLEKQITKDTIEKFISLCKEQKKDERFVILLTALCSCMDEAILSNQNDIIQTLLENEENREALVFLLKDKQNKIEIGLKDTKDDDLAWIQLRDLKEYSSSQDQLRLYNYCCAFIDLASEMCLERNHRALNYLVDIYPLEVVFKAMTHPDIDYNMKSRFVRLMYYMYIDKDPFDHLKVPNFTRIWNEITIVGNKIQFYKEGLPPYINNIKSFVIEYLKSTKGVQTIFDGEKNQMTLQVIKVANIMVSYGFYRTKDELREISVALISLLNGTWDIYEIQQEKLSDDSYYETSKRMRFNNNVTTTSVRFQKSDDNLIIMQCKTEICSTLLKILEIEDDLKMSLFLGFFKDEVESRLVVDIDPEENGFGGHLSTSKVYARETTRKAVLEEDQSNRLLAPSPRPIPPQEDNDAINWLEKVLMGEQIFDAYPQTTYVCILMDLLAYEYVPLSNRAFELVMKFFNQRAELIELLKQVQLLEQPESIKILKKVTKITSDLKGFSEAINQWANEEGPNGINPADLSLKILTCKENIDYMSNILVEKKRNPRQATLQSYSRQSSVYHKIPGTSRKNSDSLVLGLNGTIIKSGESAEDQLIPNAENQRLLKNLGVLNIIIQVLKINASEDIRENADFNDLLKSVYLFLIRFCKDNLVNQNLLGEYVDFFIKEIGSSPLVIFLIREIFKNNKHHLTTKGQKVIRYIVEQEEELDLNSIEKFHYLNILKTFTKCKNKIVKKNQNEILMQISGKDDDKLCSFFNTKEGRSKIKKLLQGFDKAPSHDDSSRFDVEVPTEVYNLVMFMDLICMCCDGKNEIAEAKAQTSVCDLESVYELMLASEEFIPLKTTIVEYFYHTWIIIGKRDLYEDSDYTEFLWKITELLVDDIERKANADEREDKVKMYGAPINLTFKKVSDKYIYSAVFLSLAAVLKLNLKFDQKDDLLRRIAKTSWQLYDKIQRKKEYRKNVLDVIATMYNSAAFTKYLDGLKHPLLDGEEMLEEVESDHEDGNKTTRTNKKNTVWFMGAERTRASIYYQKLASFAKNEEMQDILENEFEKMIIWFSDFTEHWEPKFDGIDPIIHLFNILEPGNNTLPVELHIWGLKVLRKIIETANKDLLTPSSEWDNDDWEHWVALVEAKQNFLVSKGWVEFLCKYISNWDNHEILDEAILLAIALLLGGNNESQEHFLEYMKKDESNLLCLKIKEMLLRKFEICKKLITEKNLQLLNEAVLTDEDRDVDIGENMPVTLSTLGNDIILTTEDVEDVEDEDDFDSNEDTIESSIVNCNRVLRFLQLLWENHHLGLQNFLREQKSEGVTNNKTFDFVSNVAVMFGVYIKGFTNCYSSNLGDQLMATLTEFIQGPCKENQTTIINCKVIDNCTELIFAYNSKKVLKQKGFVGEYEIELDELKMHCVTLLLSLIEGKCDDDLKKRMTQVIDNFHIVFQRMHAIYEKFVSEKLNLDPKTASLAQVTNSLQKDSFDCFIQEGFELFILIKLLLVGDDKEAVKKYKEFEAQLPPENDPESLHRSMAFYNKFTGSCEVVVKDELFKVFFPILPVCRYLSAKSKKDFLENVPRDSPQLKINGFLDAIPDFIDQMEHAESLKRGKIKITPEMVTMVRNLCFLIALVINMIILIKYEYVTITYTTGATTIRPELEDWADYTLLGLGIAQIASWSIMFFFWLFTHYSLLIKKYWRNYIELNRVSDADRFMELEARNTLTIKPAKDMPLREVRRIMRYYGVDAREFNTEGKLDFGHLIVLVEYHWLSFTFILKNGTFRYFGLLILLNVAGLVLSPAFYSFHLLDVVGRFSTLQDVVKSVTLNFKDLLTTALVVLIVLYIFAAFGFQFFYDMYFSEEVERDIFAKKGESICHNLFHCWMSVINYGLRNGGGLPDSLSAQTYADPTLHYLRSFYDLFSFLIITVILINIFNGIIIDTFAQLRDQKADFENNKNNVCFICSIDRYEFDRNGDGFEKHIERDHNVFNYLYYKIYINNKPTTEYNGTESMIGADSSWFPFHKALILENKSKEKDKEEEKNVSQIYKQIDELEKIIAGLERQTKQ